MPSAVHYVGYVEDEETPEMIMKKFEALEAVRSAAEERAAARRAERELRDGGEGEAGQGGEGAAGDAAGAARGDGVARGPGDAGPAPPSPGDGGLQDEHLVEVFKQTSMFSVKTAQLGGGFFEGGFQAMGEAEGEEYFVDLELDFDDLVDEDDEDFWGEGGRRKKKGKAKKAARPRALGGERAAAKRRFVNFYNRDTGAFVRRHVKVVDPDAVRQFVVPPPPHLLGIGRRVKPFAPPREALAPGQEGTPEVVPSVVEHVRGGTFAGGAGSPARTFLGVLLSPGWEGRGEGRAGRVEPLRRLRLSTLCPEGFVFIWVQKTDIMAVMQAMYEEGFQYVENLTWVQLGLGNDVVQAPSDFLRRSHATLYFFRHPTRGRDIELRHQRSPDVVFDGVLGCEGRRDLPGESYAAIETLLPGGAGQFLELWAPRNSPRPGWTRVLETL